MSKVGNLVISLDFEIGWGSIENGFWQYRQQQGVYRRLDAILHDLVSELDILEVPLVWATVGAMVQDPQQHNFSHLPDKLEQAAHEFIGRAEQATWDGRRLYDIISSAKTKQQIASHTYSHTRFSIEGFDGVAKLADLQKGIAELTKLGTTPDFLVYPLNHTSDFDIAKQAGIKSIRLSPEYKFDLGSKVISRVINHVVAKPPLASVEALREGVIGHRGSMLLNYGTNISAPMRRTLMYRNVKRGLKQVSNNGGIFHIWLHPYDLAEVNHLYDDFKLVLRLATKMRERGMLNIVVEEGLRDCHLS